ncbi:chorion peroxidase [Anopheles darlingi]|uniref:Chorion peroxidase n=1 Tax=Anopheles darlingi TaxID=43151 RepID=W5JFF7_ANODA|nr:chorion peroxidase [Anopheles darlingi]
MCFVRPFSYRYQSVRMPPIKRISVLALILTSVVVVLAQLENVENSSRGCASSHEQCLPRVLCAQDGPRVKRTVTLCTTPDGVEGICCRPVAQETSERLKRSLQHQIPDQLLTNAVRKGHRVYARKMVQIEKNLDNKNRKPKMTEASLVHRFHGSPFTPRVKEDAIQDQHEAYEDVFVVRSLVEALNLTKEAPELQDGIDVEDGKKLHKRCIPPKPCDPSARYRSIDGSCNNPIPERSSWGAAGHPFVRLLPPAYEDGVWAPRLHSAVTGRLLPNARDISVVVFPDDDRPDPKFNLLLMQFGQFMSHDFTRSASVRKGNEEIQCCLPDHSGPIHWEQAHFACLPITVSPNDPFYSKFGIRCLNFVRLALVREGKCKLGYGKQLNRITHFIDGSTVYGSDPETAASLRTFTGGRLQSVFPSGEELLPFENQQGACEPWASACFRAGDDRSNQIISLTEVHVLFLREHNRIAAQLAKINQNWDDERLYQETRRIVIAEIQKIFYNDYLPAIVGHHTARQYGLLDNIGHGHTALYSPDVKPLVLNELTGAAFRFGHSTVDGAFLIQHRHRRSELVPIQDVFLNPSRLLERSFFDDLLYSLIDQPQQQVDDSITHGLTRLLFAGHHPFGSDLASLNIQRGRDHALRPYNDYREWAGLPRITSFHQFGPAGERLASVYDSPDDVDLWVGGLLEPPAPGGALVGATFATILSEQFARLKYGDRYYYTNGPEHNPGHFTVDQLQEIGKASLATVICANIDHPEAFSVPQNVFLHPSEHKNPPIPCHSLPAIELGAWRGH